jgi:hypothetical protein
MKSVATWLICWLCALTAQAQRATGSIGGQVISDTGKPLPRAQILIVPAGTDMAKIMGGMHRQLTDGEGRFQADGLAPAVYQIVAMAPGYVMAALENPLTPPTFRIGDNVTIVLRKGGVITGTVTDANGKPLVGMRVGALSLANTLANNGMQMGSMASMSLGQSMQPRTTDDRGQYRLYGLLPGQYIVVANGAALMAANTAYAFAAQSPTYHPSATIDAATPVTVTSGAETTSVDIRFRGGAGYAVSGTLQGLAAGDGFVSSATTVQLKPVDSDQLLATAMVMPFGGANGFAFYGVPNGEYEIFARQIVVKDQSQQGSAPLRIKVNNADVTKLSLTLSPMSGIAGKLVLDAKAKCNDERLSELDETVLRVNRAPAQAKNDGLAALTGELAHSYPNEQGAFRFTGLQAGTFWLTTDWPSAHWYLASLTAANKNLMATGFALGAGQQLTAVTATLATNGAHLSGKLVGNDKARIGAQIFLVPADVNEQSNVYRFAEAAAQADGGFQFDNVAPGKYWLLTRAAAKPDEAPRQPLAWDATERAKLIKEAAAANQPVELKACQSLKGYELKSAN